MKIDEVFQTLNTIINECGYENILTISTKPYEIADFHIMDESYLGCNGKKMFLFSAIKRISYRRGESQPYRYVGGELQIEFELEGNIFFVIEVGNDADVSEWIFNSVALSTYDVSSKECKEFLDQYDIELSKGNEIIANFGRYAIRTPALPLIITV